MGSGHDPTSFGCKATTPCKSGSDCTCVPDDDLDGVKRWIEGGAHR